MGNGEQTGVKCVALWVTATLRFSKAPEAGFQRILIFKEPTLGSRAEDDIAMERHYYNLVNELLNTSIKK